MGRAHAGVADGSNGRNAGEIKFKRFCRLAGKIDGAAGVKIAVEKIIFLVALEIDIRPILAADDDISRRGLKEIAPHLNGLRLGVSHVGLFDIPEFVQVVTEVSHLPRIRNLFDHAPARVAHLAGKFRAPV